MEDDQYYGVLGEQINERDYLVSESGLIIPRAPKGTNSFILNGATQYNQVEAGKYSCTIHGAMGAYSDLTGFKFSLEQRKEIWQEAILRGANPNKGWWINKAVALVRDWVNANCPDKVDYYRTELDNFDCLSVMRLGYSPIIGYNGSQLFSLDKADGILDRTSFSPRTHGHCLRATYSAFDEYDLMPDNYPYKHLNIYRVPTRNWNSLVANGVFFKSAYIYILQS